MIIAIPLENINILVITDKELTIKMVTASLLINTYLDLLKDFSVL